MIRIRTFKLKQLLWRALIVVVLLVLFIVFAVRACSSSAATGTTIDGQSAVESGDVQGASLSDRLLSWARTSVFSPQVILAASLPALSSVEHQDIDWFEDEHSETMTAMTPGEDNGLQSDVSDEIRVEIKNLEKEEYTPPKLTGSGAQILIYHTHTSEAYEQVKSDPYVETSKWRTDDHKRSVVRVGDALAEQLIKKYDFKVLHDKTDHEPPKLGTSYTRSLTTMLKYQKANNDLKVFIDLHRDAYTQKEDQPRDVVKIDGKNVARIMFVVGTGEGKTGQGFGDKPNWQANYKLAKSISDELNKINPKLCREIRVKTGRYNQQVSDSCLLIECGHNGNTLTEVLNSVPYLAKALSTVLNKSAK